jgi:hypothetical protein
LRGVLFSRSGPIVQLSAEDLAIVAAAIGADADAKALWMAGEVGPLADYLNSVPPSPLKCLRTDVSARELVHALVATEFLALSPAQQTLAHGVLLAGTLDFTNPNIQQGMAQIFSPTSETFANVMALAQHECTRFEAMFLNPATEVSAHYGDRIAESDVRAAME